ncbi:MAG: hypothetical protein ACYTFU_06750 [Planctomycetota bacterium]|jgi:hypothetical protein
MKRLNKDRSLFFGVPLLIVIMCVIFVASLRIWNKSTMPEQLRQGEQLKLITDDLKLDMSRTQTIEIIDKYKGSTIRVSEYEDEIWLHTKPQLLATDWKVRLFFNDNGLIAIKYCNADNTEKRPEGAPEDITK